MRHHLQFIRVVFVAVVLFSFVAGATAQEVTGSINGTVKDANGAVVTGATVTITDSQKKVVVRTATTDDNGSFSAPDLPSALYDITVESPNFKKHLETKLKLDVGQKRTLDVSLEQGNITEVVTVEANPVAVQLTTASSSTVINGDQVRELQINNRNFVSLVTLAPGVSNDLDDLVFTGTNNPETQVVNRTLISVNGARSTQNTFTVDGADVTDRGSNLTIQAYPSVDSIGEFQVLRSLFPAESGRSGGGQINVVTRGGGDKFHGSGFEFVRNNIFNANDFQTNRTPGLASVLGREENGKLKRRPFRYNNYGFTIGGPIYLPRFGEGGGAVKKLARTFFFFSEEDRYDIRYPTLGPSTVPTSAMKQGIFPVDVCLSASSATNCTSILPAGTPLSSRATVSSVAQQYVSNIWNKIPDPTTPATLSLSYPTRNVAKFRQEIIRLDHNFSDRLSLYYRYEHDKIPTLDADGSIGGRSGLPFVNQMVSDSPGRTHSFQTTYLLNPRTILEGRFTYGYGSIFTHTTGLIAKSVSPINVNLPYASTRDVVPVLSVSGFGSLTGFSNYIDPSSKSDFSGSLTLIRGDHTMKFGALYTRTLKFENALSGANQGSFSTFSNTVLSLASPACVRATGVASTTLNTLYQNWACFLLGNNVSFSQTNLDATIDFRQNNWQAYGQDEWRFRKNLTLSYGVRYSYFGPLIDRKGLLSNFDPALWNPSAAPQVTGAGNRVAGTGNFCNGIIQNSQNIQTGPAAFNCTPTISPFGEAVYKVSKRDFAPRFGIAWDPFGKGTTSVRAGYGIYYEQIPYSSVELQALNAPYLQTISQTITSLDQPVPSGASLPIVAAATVANVRAIQTDFKTPYMQHWSLDFQRQFGAKTVVTVGYYGSKGTHLIGYTELNDLPPGKALTTQCASGSNTLQTPGVTTTACQVAGTVFTATPTILDQVRPFRGFRSLDILTPRFNSNYHALQVFATRRFTGASQFNLAYTWSKNLTDNQTSSVSTAPQDSNNIKAEYSRAVLDRRHVLSANYIYEIPFFSKRHDVVGNLLGGWQASGIITYNTGLPFTAALSSYDPAGIGYIPSIHAGGRPYLLCDPNSNAPHTADQWFNGACFSLQQPAGATGQSNAVGNAPRGAIDGPPTKRVDFTMTKNIRFSEGVRLQLRAEAFNVFNHTNFRNLSVSRAIASQTLCAVGTTVCSGFGTVTTFRDPRILQFGAKLYF
jgi:Carboxypeptidase regulatory-like domain/TonB dependent receptor